MFARLGDLGPFGQGNLTVEAVVYGARDRAEGDAADPRHDARQPRRRPRRAAADPPPAVAPLGADGLAGDAHDPRAGAPTPSGWPRRSATRRERSPSGARGRLALLRARSSAARSTARWTSPPRSRCAALPAPAARRASARPWSRHDIAFAALRRADPRPGRVLPGVSGGGARSTPTRWSTCPLGAGTIVLCAGAVRRSAAAVRRSPGDRAMTAPLLSFERVSYRYPGADAQALSEREPSRSSRESSACSRACPATASRRCCVPPAGSCRTSTAGVSPGA